MTTASKLGARRLVQATRRGAGRGRAKLKTLKLTIRKCARDQPQSFGTCIFTGAPGVEEILIGGLINE